MCCLMRKNILMISPWNVFNVTTMRRMFYAAASFNQDVSQWDVSNVTYI